MTDNSPEFFEFRLPDVGEGLEDAEIVRWMVRVGQAIEVNQVIVEIESAKSLVELPTPFAGTVVEIIELEGKVVRVGAPIIRIELPHTEGAPKAEKVEAQSKDVKADRTEILVGSGPRNEDGQRRRFKARNYGQPSLDTKSIVEEVAIAPSRPLAKPLVRKLARELGVDLNLVPGTGPDGTVTRDDVRLAVAPTSDTSRETRIPIRGVRRATADAMVASAFTAPHVTEFVTLDVTASVRLIETLRERSDFTGVRISPMTLLAKAMCIAFKKTPEINSFWDEKKQEIALKHFVNLGIATATDRGLLVPHVADADQLSLPELAVAINNLVEVARAGRVQPHQMIGGTMSITNIGVFGIDSGTPILPPGESAIISLGAVVERPWVINGEIVIRHITTLALSFDHRLVDGAQGSKFLSDVAGMLQAPHVLNYSE
jgi:2-oxoisovalerate dehydrogenase E2 component (dihydrolipoyl transacylase)